MSIRRCRTTGSFTQVMLIDGVNMCLLVVGDDAVDSEIIL